MDYDWDDFISTIILFAIIGVFAIMGIAIAFLTAAIIMILAEVLGPVVAIIVGFIATCAFIYIVCFL